MDTSAIPQNEAQYDAWGHLCSELDGRGLVVVINLYVDATYNHPRPGSSDPQLHAISGYAATVENWKRTNREWRRELAKAGLQHFHMKDFEFAKNRLAYGDPIPESHAFHGWTTEKLDALFARLVRTITRPTDGEFRLYPCTSGVLREDFTATRPPELKNDIRCKSEYVFSVYALLRSIAGWAKRRGYEGKIKYVFATGDKELGQLQPLYRYIIKRPEIRKDLLLHWDLTECLKLETMEEAPPIQMADIAAYENREHILQWFRLGCPERFEKEQSRPTLQLMAKKMEYSGFIYNQERLQTEFDDMMRLGIWK